MYTTCTSPPVTRLCSMYRSRCVYTTVAGFHSVHVCVCVCMCVSRTPARSCKQPLHTSPSPKKGLPGREKLFDAFKNRIARFAHTSPHCFCLTKTTQPQPAAVKGVFLYTGNQTLDSLSLFSRSLPEVFARRQRHLPKTTSTTTFCYREKKRTPLFLLCALWVQLFHFSIMCQYIPHRQKTQET